LSRRSCRRPRGRSSSARRTGPTTCSPRSGTVSRSGRSRPNRWASSGLVSGRPRAGGLRGPGGRRAGALGPGGGRVSRGEVIFLGIVLVYVVGLTLGVVLWGRRS